MSRKPERPDPSDDPVAQLVRLAGRREPAPERVVNALREATAATWHRQLAARRRRRSILLAAAALAVLATGLALLWTGPLAPRTPRTVVAEVERVDGQVHVVGSGAHGPVAPGGTLYEGTVVETGGGGVERGRLALRLADGHHLRLGDAGRLRLAGGSRVELERGALYAESEGDGTVLEIVTRWGTVRDLGTRFEVRVASDSLRVRVREGRVSLSQEGPSRTVEVEAGRELQVQPDGSVELRPAAVYGESWDWILGLSPGFDIEDRSLRELLDWVAGETGWHVEALPGTFADRPTILHGSIAGLHPAEALATVLPGCDLRYRIEEGRLLIEPDDSEGESEVEGR